MDEITSVGIDGIAFKQFNYMNWAVNQTFTYANNSMFYAQVNPTYYDYYNRIVKLNLQWFDGYVFGLHNQLNGVLSTRIATAIVNGIISNVFSNKLVYDRGSTNDDYSAINFFSNWAREHNFLEDLKTLSKFSGASGTAVLKLNQSYGNLWCQTLRQDQFIFETDGKGNISSITMFMKPYENLYGREDNYFVVEKRYFTNDIDIITNVKLLEGETKSYKKKPDKPVPVVEYKIMHYHGQILNNEMCSGVNFSSLSWHDLPSAVRDRIKKDFTALYFDKPQLLPFKNTLGCFMLQINGKDPTIATGNFGHAFLTDIRSSLIEYELINSYSMRDMYNAQGQVGIPKAMSMEDLNGTNPYNAPKGNYEVFPGDPDKQKPIITQFELRAAEWTQKKDDCLKKIATTLGMSPKVIASYLNTAWSNNFSKTATEVQSDNSENQIFLEDKRENLLLCVNQIIKCVLRFYGYYQDISARFLKTNSNPTSQDIQDIDFKYKNGYIDLREALRELNPTVSEQELDVLYEKAKIRQEEIKKEESFNVNEFGEYE